MVTTESPHTSKGGGIVTASGGANRNTIAMNGPSGTINPLPHLEDGRCGVDSHNRDEGGQVANKTNNDNNNGHDNDNSNNNDNNDNGNDDYEHTPDIRQKSGKISEKWSIFQARKTSDAQSKVYDRGRKKPDGIDYEDLKSQRIQRVRNAARRAVCAWKRGRRARRVEHSDCEQSANEARNETVETPQRERHHPKTQRARHNFWKVNAPTANQIMDRVKKVSRKKKAKRRDNPIVVAQQKDGYRQRKEALKRVNNLVSLLNEETCGRVE